MAYTQTFKHQVLDHAFRNNAMTSPETVYVGLLDGDPGNGGTEVDEASYDRQSVSFGAPSGGEVTTDSETDFGTAGESWGTVTHFAIFDAETGGTMLVAAELSQSKPIEEGDSVRFPAGELTLDLNA